MLNFDQKAVRFAKRFFETPALFTTMDEVTARELIGMYSDKIDALLAEDK